MTQTQDAARELTDRYWEGLLELEPILGTMVGDERHDDRLPDPSDAGRAARETFHRSALDELALMDRDVDDESLRTTLDVLTPLPLPQLLTLALGLPVAACAAGWLLAGREPPAIARRALD